MRYVAAAIVAFAGVACGPDGPSAGTSGPLVADASFELVLSIPEVPETGPFFDRISGVSLGPSRDRVYVADQFGPSVRVFGMDGRLIDEFGPGGGGGQSEFDWPSGLTLVGDEVRVVDTGTNRIFRFSSRGEYVGSRAFLPRLGADGRPQPLHRAQAILRHGQALLHDGSSSHHSHVLLTDEENIIVDTLFTVPRGSFYARTRSRPDQLVGVGGLGSFGWSSAWTWAGDSVVVLVNNIDGAVTWHSVGDGALEEIRSREIGFDRVEVPLTEAEVRRHFADRLGVSLGEITDVYMPEFEAWLGGSNVAAENGDVWVTRRYGPEVRASSFVQRRIIVPFDESRPIREVELPQNFALMSVAGDLLLGRYVDPLTEVQSLRAYRFVLKQD